MSGAALPLAIIPARGGSKRIPRKNIVDVCGKPMIAWAIETALQSGLFGKVVVSTEDSEIADVSRKYGADVVTRPAELATDTAAEIDAYAHVLAQLGAPEYFCAIYPTAILITPDDLKLSFEKFESDADVVMGVSEYPIHPFKALQTSSQGYLSMVHPYECNMLRSQEYPHYVASNGTFYWFRTAPFLQNPDYYPEKLAGYVVPSLRAVDIDVPADLDVARLFKQKQLGA